MSKFPFSSLWGTLAEIVARALFEATRQAVREVKEERLAKKETRRKIIVEQVPPPPKNIPENPP